MALVKKPAPDADALPLPPPYPDVEPKPKASDDAALQAVIDAANKLAVFRGCKGVEVDLTAADTWTLTLLR